jgi:transcriptional antiterminator RfaH
MSRSLSLVMAAPMLHEGRAAAGRAGPVFGDQPSRAGPQLGVAPGAPQAKSRPHGHPALTARSAMNSAAMPFWAVARTAPNRERLAYENVALRGYEIFVPRIRTRVGGQWKTASLFPCYLFVRVVDRWRAIERAPGVLALIKFGETPARCPDEEVGQLIGRADRDGVIRLGPRPPSLPRHDFPPGATVAIADGPFRGLSAVYAGMTTSEREVILLSVLGAPRRVEISAGLLAPR